MHKILLVDDEPTALRYLQNMLEQRCPAYRVVGACENGREALEQMEALAPDVVLTDVRMPIMDGLTLANKLKQNYPDVKVIIISGYRDFEYAKTALKSGVCDYLLKPVTPSQLQETLDALAAALEARRAEELNELVGDILRGERSLDERQISRLFPAERYLAALLRWNEQTNEKPDKPPVIRDSERFGELITVTVHRDWVILWPFREPGEPPGLCEAVMGLDGQGCTIAATAEPFVPAALYEVLPRLQAKAAQCFATGQKQCLLMLNTAEGSDRVDSEPFFEAIIDYMNSHLAEQISLLSLCQQFGISQTYLSKMFRKYTGQSFSEYLTQRRIGESMRLIRSGAFTLKEVSELVGFSDPTYFSRVFKSVAGVSPSSWTK